MAIVARESDYPVAILGNLPANSGPRSVLINGSDTLLKRIPQAAPIASNVNRLELLLPARSLNNSPSNANSPPVRRLATKSVVTTQSDRALDLAFDQLAVDKISF